MIRRVAYADGAPYRAPQGLWPKNAQRAVADLEPFDLAGTPGWPLLWKRVQGRLCRLGFQTSTLRVYRQVLRCFRDFSSRHSPSGITHSPSAIPDLSAVALAKADPPSPIPPATAAGHIRPFIDELVRRDVSASWLQINIGVLRTVYDKFGGLSITRLLRTPRRPILLPDVLSEGELTRLIAATPTARDRLLIGFLYGCGLRVGEACRLRWSDLDPTAGRVQIVHASPEQCRTVTLPADLCPLLAKGKDLCSADDYIFPGGRSNPHLSERTVERLIRKAGEAAKLTKIVTCMTLRHSHAHHRLTAGDDIRTVQEDLGHGHVETTMRYLSLIHSDATRAAVDRLSARVSLAGVAGGTGPNPEGERIAGHGSSDSERGSPISPPTPPAARDFALPPAALIFPLERVTFDWQAFLSGMRARLTSRLLALRARAGLP